MKDERNAEIAECFEALDSERLADATAALRRRFEAREADAAPPPPRCAHAVVGDCYNVRFPSALDTSPTINSAVRFTRSSTGFISTMSMPTILAESHNISMAKCASR